LEAGRYRNGFSVARNVMKIAFPTVGDALHHYAIGYVAAVEKATGA
jgi:hypothetical protein